MPKTSSRVLTLLSLLQTRRDWPGRALAERLDVSARTVRRDVDRLRELGYRIRASKGPDGGYRLEAGDELPPLLFDDEQAVALSVALQAAALSAAGIEEAALRALTSVRQVMPVRLRHRLEALRFTTVVDAAVPVAQDTLVEVSAAIRACEELRFDYARVGDRPGADLSPVPRRVQPHHLIAAQGRWYLIGWDAGREDWRVHRVDRMTLRSHRGARFTPRVVPGGDSHAFLRGRFRGATDGEKWPCRGKVVLRAPASRVIPFVSDGVVEPVGADSCLVELGAWSWGALAALLLRFEVDVEVVEPPELTAAFAEIGQRVSIAAGGERRGERSPQGSASAV
ncbi:WYL domain-containing protein [Microbacterium sp. QXD-8]|uniref:WYL domain-containing protein n=1 Tax=Microbacterium psychrotolerans TaxID=3068321 RepID=A0ABU0YVN9_9MICO|nr:WYL domain-containing protein [Microbacterium sp. QXD-8]MDQ7876398.1 WYL domain-containing protein [Microbacterium sp. QXD-8]